MPNSERMHVGGRCFMCGLREVLHGVAQETTLHSIRSRAKPDQPLWGHPHIIHLRRIFPCLIKAKSIPNVQIRSGYVDLRNRVSLDTSREQVRWFIKIATIRDLYWYIC